MGHDVGNASESKRLPELFRNNENYCNHTLQKEIQKIFKEVIHCQSKLLVQAKKHWQKSEYTLFKDNCGVHKTVVGSYKMTCFGL